MADDLRPCPFCGGEAQIETGMQQHWIECQKCPAMTSASYFREDVILAWNARPASRKQEG